MIVSKVLCILSTWALPVGIPPVVKVCLHATREVISLNRSDRNVAPRSVCSLSTLPYRHTIWYKNTSAAVFAVLSFVLNASSQPVNRSMNVIIYQAPLDAYLRGPIKSHCTTCHGREGVSQDLASALYFGARFLSEHLSHALTYDRMSLCILPQ